MMKIKILKKSLKLFSEILIFLLILASFVYSAYKIIDYTGILRKNVWGASCQECGSCQQCLPCQECGWCGDFCEGLREWCGRRCPKPSPTPVPEPTPTVPEPTPTLPEPTPTVPEPKPTPTPTTQSPSEEPPAVGGPGEPYVCGAEVPPAPTLLSVTSSGLGQVDLNWTPVTPVTHYSISYGFSSGSYLYGVGNTSNVTFFTIGGLDLMADYCFAVRAVNDCAPSELSNEICTGVVLGAAAGQVLGVTTLADTGSVGDEIFQIFFIIGAVCLGCGLRIYFPAKKMA